MSLTSPGKALFRSVTSESWRRSATFWASPLVARQYSGTLGKTGNCQIGVSIQIATDRAPLAAVLPRLVG